MSTVESGIAFIPLEGTEVVDAGCPLGLDMSDPKCCNNPSKCGSFVLEQSIELGYTPPVDENVPVDASAPISFSLERAK